MYLRLVQSCLSMDVRNKATSISFALQMDIGT